MISSKFFNTGCLRLAKMRAVIQRVERASVSVNGNVISKIGKGYCVLLGIEAADNESDMEQIAKNICKTKAFDLNGDPWKATIRDIQGDILCVSQFTLHASLKKGSKPSFHRCCLY